MDEVSEGSDRRWRFPPSSELGVWFDPIMALSTFCTHEPIVLERTQVEEGCSIRHLPVNAGGPGLKYARCKCGELVEMIVQPNRAHAHALPKRPNGRSEDAWQCFSCGRFVNRYGRSSA